MKFNLIEEGFLSTNFKIRTLAPVDSLISTRSIFFLNVATINLQNDCRYNYSIFEFQRSYQTSENCSNVVSFTMELTFRLLTILYHLKQLIFNILPYPYLPLSPVDSYAMQSRYSTVQTEYCRLN